MQPQPVEAGKLAEARARAEARRLAEGDDAAAAEGAAAEQGTDTADPGHELISWARGLDGFVLNVDVAAFPEGRGLATNRAVSPGEVLMFIPDDHMINLRRDASSFRGRNVWSMMAGELLKELDKGEESLWSRYIRAMPAASALPLNLPALQPPVARLVAAYSAGLPLDSGSQLDGSVSGAMLQAKTEQGLGCAEELRALTPVLPEMAPWACSMVLSREFNILTGRGGELWPVSDMQNHNADSAKRGTKHIKEHRGLRGHGLVAKRPYAKGEQIFDYYGLLSNLALLTQYGFVTPDNPVGTMDVIDMGALTARVGACIALTP